jgi:cytoskeletal protein CcmA (bactofilin family)
MFQKKSQLKPASAPRAMSSSRTVSSTFSVLGPDAAIRGDISASADLHIDGHVDGDITCASLVQGEASEIVGAIRAESARLSGRVRGSITARDLVILKSAHIDGDVFYDALTIEQGAQVDGRFAPRSAAAASSESAESHLVLASGG